MKSGAKFTISRDYGHPWTMKPGWDLMEVEAESESELTRFIRRARDRYWQEWIRDNTGAMRAVLYKPSGATAEWIDKP